jgi:hypothetical protein
MNLQKNQECKLHKLSKSRTTIYSTTTRRTILGKLLSNPSQRIISNRAKLSSNYGKETPQMYDNQTLVEIAEQTF